MGSYTPPPGPKTGTVGTQPPKAQPVKAQPVKAPPVPSAPGSPTAEPEALPDVAPGEFTGSVAVPPPLTAAETGSRLKIPEKKVPLGPKLSTIFITIVLAGVVVYLVQKVPARVASMQLQKWAGPDNPTMEWGNPRMCGGTAGCLTVYLSTDKASQQALENCISLADDVAEKGIETVFVIGKDSVKNSVKMARSIRRDVLFDPNSEWAAAMKIKEVPTFVVFTVTGEVKLTVTETPTAATVTGVLQ